MAKRLPKPYRQEPNNGRFPNELSIVIMSDFTGFITSTNSLERAEATVKKNNKNYPFGVPIMARSFAPFARQNGIKSDMRKIETDSRRGIHDEGVEGLYYQRHKGRYKSFARPDPFGPFMVSDPLHLYLNQ